MQKSTKIIFYSFLTLFILVGAIYALLFSAPGNGILRPVIEKALDSRVSGKLKLTNFRLSPNVIKLSINIDKNSMIKLDAKIDLFSESIDGNYSINIKKLSNLPLSGANKLDGSLKTNGHISGNWKKLYISGKSDIFGGITKYKITIKRLNALTAAKVYIKAGEISKLLAVKLIPAYINGLFNIYANIEMKGDKLTGLVITKVYSAALNRKAINKNRKTKINRDYKLTFASKTIIQKGFAKTQIEFKSNPANISSKDIRIDLADKSIKGDYLIKIPDLQKIEFIMGIPLRGFAAASGTISKGKRLLVSGRLLFSAGSARYRLKDALLKVDSDNIESSKLLYMLFYPQVFRSRGKVRLLYNLKQKEGKFSGKFADGRIERGLLTNLIKNILHFDITGEIYKETEISGNISKNAITANLDMKSSITEISSKRFKINLNKNTINSEFKIAVKKQSVLADIYGDLKSPKIAVDVSKLIKSKVKKRINKVIRSKVLKKMIEKFF
ncbi:MAG: hypothetical protein GXP60_01395 [Epsilonproteobacteria bacterium]|nr:hypothetical protein [Campylobacterota bacterium]